ncbi:MAG: 3-deoxy-manno-octulosonate cytidylyltransferase [Pseudomonadota bacterium]|nr:3-deoxy-manno-octulosonate cytidylyltransferase [Pseudomonadota bacterium]
MSFHVLIPARLASTRLPRKALAEIGGVPMIVRVSGRAAQSNAASVVVATDHEDIAAACREHGVAVVMTSARHATGTDRIAEAAATLGLSEPDIIVNVQGDEPMLAPLLIDACARLLESQTSCVMSTAAEPIRRREDFESEHVVKVVLDAKNRAQYFSRAPIPWPRGAGARELGALHTAPLRHVGLYAYRPSFLRQFAELAVSPLETIEQLEQLRVLWHGERIAVHVSEGQAGIGVDTPADLAEVRALFGSGHGSGFA